MPIPTLTTPYQNFSDFNLAFLPTYNGDIGFLFDANAINASLVKLVNTNFYEVPFHAEQGSAVPSSLFENYTQLTASVIQSSIQACIINFEPRVNLISVVVSGNPDQNSYTATITYMIKNTAQTNTISIFLQKIR